MEYITASCVITERAVYKNGDKVFAAGGPGTTDFRGTGANADLWPALYQHFNWQYPKYFKMDNLSRLGFAAAELLLSGWNSAAYDPEDVAVVLSNANSSLDTDYRYTGTTREIPSPSVFVYTLPNIVIGEICIRHRFKGENAFFLSPVFDAGLLARYVTILLGQDIARVCIAGWVELLGDRFKAALFLIEKKPADGALSFTPENMDRIFRNLTQ